MSEKKTYKSSGTDPIENLLKRIIREATMEENIQYATFIQRVIARLVDTAIVIGVAYGFELLAVGYVKSDNVYNVDIILKGLEQAVPALAIMLWVLLYSPIMESTGGTVGKRLVGIKLVDEQTFQTPFFRNCMARTWVYLVFIVLAVVPSIASCLAYFISDKKQTWHDKLTNMIVVKK